MKFSWDPRKARSNERKHGVSFPLAQEAFETGLGIPIDEQFEDDEWRNLVIAPYRAKFLLAIVFTIRYEKNPSNANDHNQNEESWHKVEVIVRIISARKATREEETFYLENRISLGR